MPHTSAPAVCCHTSHVSFFSMPKVKTTTAETTTVTVRPPIIVVMGHIDHGKSTLLDYIRKTNVTEKETGGITQHISAYEVLHKTEKGEKKRITFLDTPGHEAFQKMRFRGAEIADIAILVVSAEDGVKAQTLEALACITKSGIPYIVAITKIDKTSSNIERTKQTLIEHGVYLEGLGGQIPYVPLSAKLGDGVSDLLDMMLLIAELEELSGTPQKLAEGVVIESNLDPQKGISAALIIKDGSIKKGMFIASDSSVAPVRIMEDFMGKALSEATFSSPIRIVGWNIMPQAGAPFRTFLTRRDAEQAASETVNRVATKSPASIPPAEGEAEKAIIPIILKADVLGSLDAILHELEKLNTDRAVLKVIQKSVGSISESDVKAASSIAGTLVIGFNTKVDNPARDFAERMGVEVKVFDIIYKLSEWLAEVVATRTPKIETEEVTGRAKILKSFSRVKDKQILGARVETGSLKLKASVRIIRRDVEVGRGTVVSLEQNKVAVSKIDQGNEFGAQIQSKIELLPGDYIEMVMRGSI